MARKAAPILAFASCLLALNTSCEQVRDEAAEASAQLETAGEEYVLQPLREGYRENVKPQIEASISRVEEITNAGSEITEAADSISSATRDAKETVGSVATSVSETVRSTGGTIKSYARRAPRSRKEANQLVESKGRGYFEWARERMRAFVERNQLRRGSEKDKGAR